MPNFSHWGPWEWGLAASVVLALLALLIALYSVKLVRRQALQNEQVLQRIARDIAAANNGSVGMGQRLLLLEKRQQNAAQPAPANDAQASAQAPFDEAFQPYAEAAQLFQLGHSVDEVARRCGLSRAEASLLEVMQKSGSA